ncbi:hypothetical protein GJ496_009865 [Pomphorhynchus laevis]|nr:hypothetical protein GJ496_009865 [Pomphorhynchus laevis]
MNAIYFLNICITYLVIVKTESVFDLSKRYLKDWKYVECTDMVMESYVNIKISDMFLNDLQNRLPSNSTIMHHKQNDITKIFVINAEIHDIIDLSWNFLSTIKYPECFKNHIDLRHNIFTNDALINDPEFITSQVKSLDISHNHIQSVHFKTYNSHLKKLIVSSNNIKRINGEISTTLIYLEYIDLSSNRIDYINRTVFQQAGHLKEIRLANNYIKNFSKLSFSSMVSLQSIDLSNNLLFNLNGIFSRLIALESINLIGNNMVSHEFYPNQYSNLKHLYLENLDRRLTDLNYGTIFMLEKLYLINSVNISDPETLDTMNETLIELVIINPNGDTDDLFTHILMINYPNLEKLVLEQFKVNNVFLPFGQRLPKLRELSLANNDIHHYLKFFINLPDTLEILNLSHNPLISFEFAHIFDLPNLWILDITNVPISNNTSKSVIFDNVSIPSLFLMKENKLEFLCVNKCVRIDSIKYLSRNRHVLKCPEPLNNIERFKKGVIFSNYNDLVLPCLEELIIDFSKTLETNVILFSAIKVQSLILVNGSITKNFEASLKYLQHVESLELTQIRSTIKDIFYFTSHIKQLTIANCNLINDGYTDFSKNLMLQKISITNTTIEFSAKMFCASKFLKYLLISDGGIMEIPKDIFDHCYHLEELKLPHNKIRYLHLFGNDTKDSSLKVIDLSNNYLRHVNLQHLSELSSLRYIYLNNNFIYEVHIFNDNIMKAQRNLEIFISGNVQKLYATCVGINKQIL